VYSDLAVDRKLLDRRLGANRAVLTGHAAPGPVASARSYGAYYAVTWANESVPVSFRPIYANRLYVLSEVPRYRSSRVLVSRYACPTYDTCRPRRQPLLQR
jgi:hypothetical protein